MSAATGPFVLELVGWADGGEHHLAGRYLQDADVELVWEDEGWLSLTEHQAHAKTFSCVLSVLLFLRRTPLADPFISEGVWHRPLTNYTWEMVPVERAA